MTANDAPAGVASAGGATGITANAWKAFNRSSSTYYLGANSAGSTWPAGWIKFDFGSNVTIGGYDVVSQDTEASGYDISLWKLEGSTDDSTWVELHDMDTQITNWGNGERRNYTVTSPGAYRYYRIIYTRTGHTIPDAGGRTPRIGFIQMYAASAAPNVTLVSNAVTALAVPTSVFTILYHETVDSVTLNSDLLVYASRDGGTNYTAGTLAVATALAGNQQILTATVDVSGQPSGVAMKWKIVTANAKSQRIHAISQQWS
jgi:hypothetical protein